MQLRYLIGEREQLDVISRQVMKSYVAAYQGLMTDAYLSSLTPDYWRAILCDSMDKGDVCLVVEHAGEIVGSAVFGVSQESGEICAQWHSFYLLPDFVGCGVGHTFYKAIEHEMRKRGCTTCMLEVLSANARAIRFYLAHGFVKTRTFTVDENGMLLQCDTMEKRLT